MLESMLTCPHCGFSCQESMPTDACQFFYECRDCNALLRPNRVTAVLSNLAALKRIDLTIPQCARSGPADLQTAGRWRQAFTPGKCRVTATRGNHGWPTKAGDRARWVAPCRFAARHSVYGPDGKVLSKPRCSLLFLGIARAQLHIARNTRRKPAADSLTRPVT
jgi:hypothetical protein